MKTIIKLIALLSILSCSVTKKAERKAERGDVNECLNLVIVYSYPEDYSFDKKAQEKVTKYCKLGLSIKNDSNWFDTAYAYGIFYKELAKSYLTNEKEKYKYYKMSAECGEAESQWVTYIYYLDGKGGKIDNDSALYWLKKASVGNSYMYAAMAQKELGDILIEGKLVKADSSTAMYYYKKSCACNNVYSSLAACEKVIALYKKNEPLKDTSELAIYRELARQLRLNTGAK